MNNYQVVWSGITLDSTGYGRISREFVQGLDNAGVDVKLIPLANQGARLVELSPRLKELAEKPINKNKTTIIVNCIQPQQIDIELQKEQFDFVVCNTVWETSVIPDVWKQSDLESLDAIIVPCSQNIEAIRNAKVETPIYVVPYGCDNIGFNPNNEPFRLGEDVENFTFLSVFEWGYRKAPDILLKAFWSEFKKDENVRLVIKTYAGNSNQANHQLLNIISSYKNINGFKDTAPTYVTTSSFNDEQLKGLYTMADTFVLVSRGEGFGMPYFESLNSGTPVIAPRWGGGRADILKDDFAYFAEHTLVPAKTHEETGHIREMHNLFNDNMLWAETDIDSLRKQMRYVFEHRDEAKAKGIAGRKALLDLTWNNAGLKMKETLESIIRRKA